MNEEDSEQIALSLQQIGFQPAVSWRDARVIILNTCSVRKKPEDKAFSFLGSLAKLKQDRPELIIGVCGCMAQLRADEIKQRVHYVDFVLGTGQITEVASVVEEISQKRRFQKRIDLPERKGAVVTDIPQRHVERTPKLKSFVPIQYGCDKFCSFCIVPTTRGRERSRPTEDILEEVTKLAANGTKEVTLLGQTVNSYGKNLAEGRVPFSKLLWLLSEIEGLERIRYTSPYPRDFKRDLIETIRDCPKVMEHVHMPLQSGDDDVLKAMKRQYTVESFLGIVDELRTTIPGVGLTTDVIVGFPGETDKQFENTLNLMKQIRFDGAYMFIYSPRPGTPASSEEQIPYNEKQARLATLLEMQSGVSEDLNFAQVGKTVEVMIEGPLQKDASLMHGFSRDFRKVHFAAQQSRVGRIAQVRIDEGHQWGVSGSLA